MNHADVQIRVLLEGQAEIPLIGIDDPGRGRRVQSLSRFKRVDQSLHFDRQRAVIMLRKPGQNRPPNRAFSGDLTTGATSFKTQRTAQLRRPAMGIRGRWTLKNPRCFP
jgi:hypothetical protein